MSVDIRALAIRFADLWAVNPHTMVDEIYSPDIEMENMANPSRVILGGAQLHAVEDRLSALIPEHRHELVRVMVDGDVACLETTIVAPATHEYAPACVWWWIDRAGQVAAETGWFDWADRSTDSGLSHGTVPPHSRNRSSADGSSGRQLADDYAARWTSDPTGTALEMFAPSCTFGRVGVSEDRGVDALRTARRHETASAPGRAMVVDSVVGEGASVALLVTVGDADRVTRGTIVLTLDDDDLIISERRYLDWNRAVRRNEMGSRPWVGTAGWARPS